MHYTAERAANRLAFEARRAERAKVPLTCWLDLPRSAQAACLAAARVGAAIAHAKANPKPRKARQPKYSSGLERREAVLATKRKWATKKRADKRAALDAMRIENS